MALCSTCGLSLSGDLALCPHHVNERHETWAQGNKIWCDYFHRGVPIKRVDDFKDDG